MLFRKKKSSQSVLGIDINRDQIKMVELTPINNDPRFDYKITNYKIEDLPGGIFYNSDRLESEQLGEILKDIVSQEKLFKKKAVCAVPSDRVITKYVSVPIDATENEVENLIKNSSKTYATTGIETMAFDFYEDEAARTDSEKTYVLKMVNVEAVQSREDAILIGDLIPTVIETDDKPLNRLSETFAAQYLSEIGEELDNTKDAYLLIEIRKQTVIATTMNKGKVDSHKEQVIKQEYGNNQESIFNQVVKFISQMLFVAQSNHNNIKGIFLSGDNKTLFGLREYMEEDSSFDEIEILISNPLFNIEFSGVNFEDVMDSAPSLVIACGLAMREVSQYE